MAQYDTQNPTSGTVRSLERALDLLMALESASHSMGVSELARATNMPKQTAQRLLKVLERRSLVQKHLARYQLGAGTVPLAGAFLMKDGLIRTSFPILGELAQLVSETVTLFVRQGFDRVVVQRFPSTNLLRYSVQIGQRMPLLLGASGLVLAAAMPEDELRQLFDQVRETWSGRSEELDEERLMGRLRRVKDEGLAVSYGEREPGLFSVAAPIVRPCGETIAAIAVTGPQSRMTEGKMELISIEIRRAAHEIAQAYGLV